MLVFRLESFGFNVGFYGWQECMIPGHFESARQIRCRKLSLQ